MNIDSGHCVQCRRKVCCLTSPSPYHPQMNIVRTTTTATTAASEVTIPAAVVLMLILVMLMVMMMTTPLTIRMMTLTIAMVAPANEILIVRVVVAIPNSNSKSGGSYPQ